MVPECWEEYGRYEDEGVCLRGDDCRDRVGVDDVESGRSGRWDEVEDGVSAVVAAAGFLLFFLVGVWKGFSFLFGAAGGTLVG